LDKGAVRSALKCVSRQAPSHVNQPMKPLHTFPILLLVSALLLGCAATGSASPSARPVLYPNATLNRVGEAQARAQADACMARAQAAGLTPDEKNNETARRAGQGAATGGVAAAVGALVTGRGTDGAARAGAMGAAVGGSVGAVSGAMREKPSSTYRHFVQRCLSEQGLEVIGWN
jgi:outer membrane lipoprotein SlyB